MDGTVEGIPDRRISAMHTLYRDAEAWHVNLDEVSSGVFFGWFFWYPPKTNVAPENG